MKSLVFVLAAMVAGPVVADQARGPISEQIAPCWNVGALSRDAVRTSVVVGFNVSDDGHLDTGSIRLISSSGDDAVAARQAYEAARRAVIRCGSTGFARGGAKALEFGPYGVMDFRPHAPMIET